ncbi:MAG: PD40 domain-containing protein [Alloprevotella sp.]|nr:PD40 domain-containing protein [Alloprevotella sp.]
MNKYLLPLAAGITLLMASCQRKAEIPANAAAVTDTVQIYPDYRDIVIPPNIAPLNIRVTSPGSDFVAAISGGGQQVLAAAGADGKLEFNPEAWKELLTAAKGKTLTVEIYAKRDGNWVKHPAYAIQVAEEPIDRYLSYRLIEPSYELYRQVGLYQRDLETFEQHIIYENNRTFNEQENHCVNCHNFQSFSTNRMLFHVRARHGGTVLVDGQKVEKYKMTTDSTLGNAVYPAWHPTQKLIAFSSNKTGQAFHLRNNNKIEVVDYGSDLLLFDAGRGTMSNILKTDDTFETFPAWSPDGTRLYYCSAYVPQFRDMEEQALTDSILRFYDRIRYDVMYLPFDAATGSFGTPQPVVECAARGKSAAVPRVSPDGRFLLYTLGDYGQFHIWHHDCDLWVKNLETGEEYALAEANSPDVDSYHGWSSNGRWIAFASRRLDGNYSRAFIAYFDAEGRAHKAFLLPQRDPEHSLLFTKSYNVPELSRDRVSITPEQFHEAIYADDRMHTVRYAPTGKR